MSAVKVRYLTLYNPLSSKMRQTKFTTTVIRFVNDVDRAECVPSVILEQNTFQS